MSGGSKAPTPTTTQTTSTITQEPSFTSTSSNTNTRTEIPSWLSGASESMVQRANTASQTPYQAYTGPRVAGFDPLMEQAFGRIAGQQVAPQVGQGTGLAAAAGERALAAGAYTPYTMGRFTGDTAQQYMDPYMQSVVNAQLREAQREADIAATTRAGAATRAGAFGGARQAIMDAEAERNLALQKGDIQAAGLQKAFEGGRAQFNVEDALRENSRQFGADVGLRGAGQATSAAQTLGQLGQTQFQQQMDVTQGLGYAGALKQQQAQAGLDVAYQDFLAQQKYPYEQLSWLQGILAGAPHGTTQSSQTESSGVTTPGAQTSVSTAVQTPSVSTPSPLSQAAGLATTAYGFYDAADMNNRSAAGGVVGYAEGGITGYLSDPQLEQRMSNGRLPTIARLAAEMQLRENQQVRQAGQMRPPQGPRPTVAEEVMAGLSAAPVRDDLVDSRAGGGLLDYADDMALPQMDRDPRISALLQGREQTPAEPAQPWLQRLLRGLPQPAEVFSAPAPQPVPPAFDTAAETRGLAARYPRPAPTPTAAPRAGLAATAPARAAAPAAPAALPAPSAPDPLASALERMDSQYNTALSEQAAAVQKENDLLAAEAAEQVKRFDERQKRAADADAPARARIQERDAELDEQRRKAKSFAIIRAGLAMMSGESPHALVNISRGISAGVEGYAGDIAKLDEAREGLRRELDRLDQLKQAAAAATGEKREELLANVRKAEIAAKTATTRMLAAAKVDRSAAMSKALFEALTKQQSDITVEGVKQRGRLQEIAAKGAEDRRTEAARPRAVGGGAGAARGALTEKDLANARAKAFDEWSSDRLLRRQFPTVESYIAARMAAMQGQSAPAAQPPAPVKGWGAMVVD